jgi:hypothetical protein
MSELLQQQIEQNYEVFQAQLPQLAMTHPGKFALMHDREIIEFFDTARDAYVAGQKIFPGGVFSVQEVIETPVDLNTYANYEKLKEGCAACIRPKPATRLRIWAHKTGSGFSGSSFIVSSTYLEPRQSAFKSRTL